MTPQEEARARLRVHIAHFVDHAQEHIEEIAAQRSGIAEGTALAEAIDTALRDITTARLSLAKALAQLEGAPSPERHDARRPHSHAHHSHES